MADFLQGDKDAAAAQNKQWSETQPTDHLKNENPPEDNESDDAPKGTPLYNPCPSPIYAHT